MKQKSSSYSSQATGYCAGRYVQACGAAVCKQTGCCCSSLIFGWQYLITAKYLILLSCPDNVSLPVQALADQKAGWLHPQPTWVVLLPPGFMATLETLLIPQSRVTQSGQQEWGCGRTTWCTPAYSPSKGEKSNEKGKYHLVFCLRSWDTKKIITNASDLGHQYQEDVEN